LDRGAPADDEDRIAVGAVRRFLRIEEVCRADAAVRAGSYVLAFCSHQCHYASMRVQITIRDIPGEVRDELAARAALQGKSMQEYLRAELERLAARPPVEKVLERIRERKATAGTRITPAEILASRDADRR
jgi:hypothetical protein